VEAINNGVRSKKIDLLFFFASAWEPGDHQRSLGERKKDTELWNFFPPFITPSQIRPTASLYRKNFGGTERYATRNHMSVPGELNEKKKAS
jgi:hypothetical protein